ncbi:type VII secretion protein EccB [Corynebacterium hansenii]|uniref:Type VII secretion protein EccB n=1 Tax=Corynebacterium hansenii TaxID=394964 RepID=A0ABV7ZLU9_9CORY|nr:type VII secretion protein EccB [Corynebacterium hansenii]WJY99038.1 ESX-1 secretion system protein eccB1 [Corynebacterium hansenii]
MPRTPTTPAQISGHRFLVRRVEHALVRADARMLHDPLRTRGRAVAAGAALLVLVLAGTVIFGLIRPRDGTADADLLLVRDTGALHVRIDDRVHPVANLASARLVLGQPAEPVRVGGGALGDVPAGHPIGIAGAPAIAASDPPGAPAAVGVCENAEPALHEPVAVRSTVARTGGLPADDGVAALLGDGERLWLVHGGRRALIDAADPALARSLGLAGAPVRPAGPALLRALPEAPPVTVPEVPRVGEATAWPAPFDLVGRVVEVADRRVAVLSDGAVEVPPVLADVFAARFGSASATEPELAAVPVAAAPDAGSLPGEITEWAPADGWLCVDADARDTSVTVGKPPAGVVPYPGADGPGPAMDGFSGGAPGTVAVDTGAGVHLVTVDGTRHQVENRRALAVLGYHSAVPVPWRVLASLREGPELTRAAALAPA